MEIGNRTQGNFEIRSFESLKEAERYAKKNHDPDKAPTEAKVYAYAVGEWLPVMWKAI